MRAFFLILLIFGSIQDIFAQKPLLDSSSYRVWQHIEQPIISNDGNYVCYSICKGVLPFNTKQEKLVVTSSGTNWQLEINNKIRNVKFTSDSKYCLFNTADSLGIVDLKSKTISYIPNISNFKIDDIGAGEWIVIQKKDKPETVVLRNLKTRKQRIFSGMLENWFSEDGKILLMHALSLKDEKKNQHLTWLNLDNGVMTDVWKGLNLENLIFDYKAKQLAFRSNDSVFYYKLGMVEPVCIYDPDSRKTNERFRLGSLEKFSKDGERLYVSIVNEDNKKKIIDKNAPEIWSYTDPKLQTVQERELTLDTDPYLAVIPLNNPQVIHLQKYENEMFFNRQYEDIVLSSHQIGVGDYRESQWNLSSRNTYDIVSGITGKRESLNFLDNNSFIGIELSPEGKYVLYYDTKESGYFVYDVTSGTTRGVTKNINTSWFSANVSYRTIRGIAAWSPGDKFVLIYDSNDIWKIDPTGTKRAFNITGGYGLKHNIIFSLGLHYQNKVVPNTQLLLSAFDTGNKHNGFFCKDLNQSGNPSLLTIGPYLYDTKSIYVPKGANFSPVKARNREMYLVRRQSANEAPNLFTTTDFRCFKSLTDINPSKGYNWYSAELHSWESLDGRKLQGVLYKPENFDPNQKYPIIFNLYELLSDRLNAFLDPKISTGRINIPTYVSNGYLVFTPDIWHSVGDPMQGTYDAVVSAAQYISKLPYVNADKLGIQGHSFGGVQVNYLVTRTNLFAAACSASGLSDWISGYGTLYGNPRDGYDGVAFGTYEMGGQLRMGAPIWGNLEKYINNSPILFADKVVTPLLMEHGKEDPLCPYPNIVEFFLGLRRLGKTSWMLAYPNGSHELSGRNAEDFSARMMQFFDHYLKNKAAPVWMIDGVKAASRRFTADFQLDTLGRKPGTGLISKKEQSSLNVPLNESRTIYP
ncbi:S9 family peptidase [Pedobacter panaciterrae]|uniref:alpha/beta hydrolase family protein n=1 Tax=Pedobacter panaciterrae TaxID=363849 RepID=UPI00155DA173|nr:prolyl oligopeptidase family serine peptidase [Pedobacter panaciterrae]NQX54431.1 S9 family peptidase [Pedobacter panaciterrae]